MKQRAAYYCNRRAAWVLPLTRGYEALIDAKDRGRIEDRCWSVLVDHLALRAICPHNRRQRGVPALLHHYVVGASKADRVKARNGDLLDCRRANLSHNEPLYVLPGGIKVMAEVAPSGRAVPYWRIYVLPNELVPGAVATNGWVLVRRSRAVLASVLGRALTKDEHAHHKNHVKTDDRAENLELLTAAEHNKHHKTGARHTAESKQRIAATLREAFRTGRRKITGAVKQQMEARRAADS